MPSFKVSRHEDVTTRINLRTFFFLSSGMQVPSESDVLKETCSYIRKLRGEVEELSDRLSQLLSNTGFTTADVELIKAILLH